MGDFHAPTSWSNRLNVPFSIWRKREEELFNTTKSMKAILDQEEEKPFGGSNSVLSTPVLKPDDFYQKVIQYQGLG